MTLEAPIRFPCSGCGAQMVFDAESQQLKCTYCGNLAPIEIPEGYEEPMEYELDFTDESDESLKDWGTEQQVIKCENCGAETLIPAQQTAAMCAFCGSPKVLPQGSDDSIRPESLIPFHISKDRANELFLKWKKKKWFVPNAFKKQQTNSNVTGIYIPFWTFDAQTESDYSAEVGVYHYRTETRTRTVDGKTETYTEQVRYTVWHSTSGNYERFFNDILIPASSQHDKKLIERFHDFNLKDLYPYKPEFLSGFTAERYNVHLRDGWDIAKARIDDGLESDIRSNIGGDEIRNLSINTDYYDQTYKHILLPLWNATYAFKNKTYHYMVNGETGSISGKVPRSGWKITSFVLLCLIITVGIILYFS
ncbi:hypothetical protein GRF59_04800 [Paenibacillus sp. HJL G12]|uniref:TFIIB-type zinc ribbon-containing protein n=1 Tax=Paenibacillus dendrobii TaxID=2691084 RepID=A0A7X3IFI0_9BACL|nr:ShlB/FhaC/HecB family hemolysin secretion/activation protein [Paenibacillus dendrobii]MWV42939.1 hypothetical protein [Paenibacillus dendrobii]